MQLVITSSKCDFLTSDQHHHHHIQSAPSQPRVTPRIFLDWMRAVTACVKRLTLGAQLAPFVRSAATASRLGRRCYPCLVPQRISLPRVAAMSSAVESKQQDVSNGDGDYQIIKEGRAVITYPRENEVFYNKVQVCTGCCRAAKLSPSSRLPRCGLRRF